MKGCKSNINRFCYCCGKYVPKSVKKGTFSAEFIEAYEKYFSQRVVLQKCWVPNIVCKNCYNRLIDWTNGKRKCMQFGVPMIWTHPGPVHKKENCYACANKGAALRKKKERKSFKYVEVQSAQTPLPHSDNIPAPQCPSPTILSTTTFESFIPDNHKDPEYNLCVSNQPILVSQSKLDSLVAKLELTQRKSEELASFLRSQNLLAEDVRVTVYRSRQSTMQTLFVVNDERTSAYCPDVEKLMDAMNIINYKAEDWRLFIDSSKCSLKAILLHKTNEKPSIPIAYSTETKETYEALENILKMVEYSKHRWRICCDLKVVAILSGLQSGYVKHMCFICDWDSRYSGNQYACHDWKQREHSKFAMANIIRKPLVPKDNILLPPLHIKLGLVKNVIKTIAKRNDVLLCLKEIYPRLSESKIKEGVLNGPDIRKLIKSHSFNNVLHTNEVAAWKYLKDVINGLQGKNRSTNYHVSVANMLKSFSKIGVHMSLKIHYLHHHLPYFSKQLSTESDEQGERFHQVAAPFEMRYRGKQSPAAIIAEICWWSKQIFENNGNDDLEERAAGRAVDSPVEIMFDSDSDDTSDCDIDNIVSKPLPLKRAKVTFVN